MGDRPVSELVTCRKCRGTGRQRREPCRSCRGTGLYPPPPAASGDEKLRVFAELDRGIRRSA